MTDSTTTAQHK